MKRRISKVGFNQVRNLLTVRSYSKSDRGSAYSVDSVVINTEGKSKEEIKRESAAAVKKLLGVADSS